LTIDKCIAVKSEIRNLDWTYPNFEERSASITEKARDRKFGILDFLFFDFSRKISPRSHGEEI